KPFDSRNLCRTIEEAAGAAKSIDLPSASSSQLSDEILARVGGDRALLTDMIRLFADDAPQTVTRIRAAIDSRDGAALRRAAHTLKGAAANFEATDLMRAARALEEIGQSGCFDEHVGPWRALTVEM